MTDAASLPTFKDCQQEHPNAIAQVLVCLDRSALSDGCLPYAGFAAKAFGAKLTLLHVLPSATAAHEPNRADALEAEIAKREADHYLDDAMGGLDIARERLTGRVAQGSPAEQIAAVAQEIRADLTILCSHGQGAEGRTSELGSVAQHVLSRASGSVLLVQPMSMAPIPPNRILVPLDGSMRSECVLPMVTAMGKLHGAEVLLLHVVTEPRSTAVLSTPQDMQLAQSLALRIQQNAEDYLSRIRVRLLPELDSVKTLVVRRAEERQALIDVAVDRKADMLVLAAHGTTCNADRAFGSVTSFLLSHARLPIFVLQDMPRRAVTKNSEPPRLSLSSRPPEVD
ncbi:MAG: universal stress protein [Polyangiaceae bacterium]